ncbi:MAG: hypothetical protein H6816_03370 [Phycisphaerales bacterium]|nr:hypothetical protein [Phycisphaerales bacterium]
MGARTASLTADNDDEVMTMSNRRLTEDEVAARQSVDAYNSLEDGQPGDPGTLELQLEGGWVTATGEHDVFPFLAELQYNGSGSEFLENTQFTLGVPVEMGIGGVEGNGDLELGWQQRWIEDDGTMPTIATLAEVRIPTGYHSSGVDGTLTAVVAKDLGPGTAYFNAFGRTVNGDNGEEAAEFNLFAIPWDCDSEDVRHFQWGFRAGYKWRISDEFALIGDYVNQSSEYTGHGNSNLLEVSGEWHVNDRITVGPGVVIGLDDNDETPNFGAGVRMMVSF